MSIRPLEFATEMLKARLSRRMPLGVNIVSPHTAEMPTDLNDHPGNFVGFFIWLGNGDPASVMLSRNLPLQFGISHVHVYYVNTQYKEMPQEDKQRFARKKLAPHVSYCVVNLRAKAPKFLNLSVLIQALEVTLRGARLSLGSVAWIDVRTSQCFLIADQRLAKLPDTNWGECGPTDVRSRPIFDRISALGLKWCEISNNSSPGTLPSDFDIVRVHICGKNYGGSHCIYGIHYKPIKVLMLLISHSYLFQSRDDYEPITQLILTSLRPYKLRFMGATRYYGPKGDAKCYEDNLLEACILALEQPLITIKHTDLETILTDDYYSQMLSEHDPESQFTQSTASVEEAWRGVDASFCDYVRFNPLGEGEVIESGPADMNISSLVVSTQATDIFDPRDVMSTVRAFNAQMQLREDLTQLLTPPVIPAIAFDDPRGRYLNDDALFVQYLKMYIGLWNAYASAKVLDPLMPADINRSEISEQSERFIAQPVVGQRIVIVILRDTSNNDWAYLNPYFRDDPLYNEAHRVAQRILPGDNDVVCRSISLTSYFHTKYKRIHVLMGAFYLGKLFKDAILLPQRVFYLERDFRHLCWKLCHSLQVANAEYNLENNLVNELGYLKEGAMRCRGSPVSYTSAVVSRKECPFCSSRRWDNLSSHIRMTHGGLASRARWVRAQRDLQRD